jgi:hypothetical protein
MWQNTRWNYCWFGYIIFWLYCDDDSFCLTFELSGNMDLLCVHPHLWEKCEGYKNLTNEQMKMQKNKCIPKRNSK